jgi:CRISPR-associated protein Cmr1
MNEPLTITLKTLTPLWTGGADGTSDRLHVTGIVGSLRWWYEALVRGLGGEACDPTEHGCNFDVEKYETRADLPERERLRAAGLCDACQLFGATGWRRRFRLQVNAHNEPAWEGDRALNVRPYGRSRGWFLSPGRVGTITVSLMGDQQALAQMFALFRFLERWGSLGPRPQLGYGVFRLTEVKGGPPPLTWDQLGNAPVGALPDLRSFTFFKLQFIPREDTWWTQVSGLRELRGRHDQWLNVERLAGRGMVPVTPALKNTLRFEQRWSSNALPHWLFGTLRGDERVRRKVALSWAFRLADGKTWEIRGWVFLPDDARGRAVRTEVTTVLRQVLERPQSWQQALGLQTAFRDAALTFAPSASPWQMHNRQQIADFLNTLQSEATQ